MIINISEYNPLEAIFKLLPDEQEPLTIYLMDLIRKELFKGGVCVESDEEFEKVLEELHTTNILELNKVGHTYNISKGTIIV